MASDRPVILLDVPDMTGDLVRELAEYQGAEIARRREGEERREAVRRSGGNVVVVGADGDDVPNDCRALLREQAALRVVGIGDQGRFAIVSWLRPEVTWIDDVSAERLLAEVRGGA